MTHNVGIRTENNKFHERIEAVLRRHDVQDENRSCRQGPRAPEVIGAIIRDVRQANADAA